MKISCKIIVLKSLAICTTVTSDKSRISQGRDTSILFDQTFLEKCMKTKKIGPKVGGRDIQNLLM